MRTAVLYRCHKLDAGIVGAFSKMRSECTLLENYCSFLALHNQEDAPQAAPCENFLQFTANDISQLRYVMMNRHRRGPLWYNNEYSMLLFFQKEPDFDYYWMIDWDVVFHGAWDAFFSVLNSCNADFVAARLLPYCEEEKDWTWWPSLNFEIDLSRRWRCFLPAVRFSRPALDFLDQEYKKGRHGFSEAVIPTLLFNGGFTLKSLVDFPEVFDPAVFRFKPPISAKEFSSSPGKLLHPVKYA